MSLVHKGQRQCCAWCCGDGSSGGDDDSATQADDMEALNNGTTAPYLGMEDEDERKKSGKSGVAGEHNALTHASGHEGDSKGMSEIGDAIVIEPTGSNGQSSVSDFSGSFTSADAAMSAR